MSDLIYRVGYRCLVLPVLRGGFQLSVLFFEKSRQAIRGRKGLTARVRDFRSRYPDDPILLLHCASAGELESLKPIVARLNRSKMRVAISFFSPSAEHAAKQYSSVDFVDYSPLDDSTSVNAYLEAMKPDAIAISKHDVWPNFIWSACDRDIPVVLINGNFPPNSLRLHPLSAGFHRSIYSRLLEIQTVSDGDANRIRTMLNGSANVVSVGDSRFDQVKSRIAEQRSVPGQIEEFCDQHTVMVAGSTHPRDEVLLFQALPELFDLHGGMKVLIVPHDPSQAADLRVRRLALRYGLQVIDIDNKLPPASSAGILLVNRKGMLADLYRFGHLAFVGGGFDKGVHSVIEPMAAGLPVICGPRISVSNEAQEARVNGILRVARDTVELKLAVREWLATPMSLEGAKNSAQQFVTERCGAADTIAERLQEMLLESIAR